jgi:hypothetical protein
MSFLEHKMGTSDKLFKELVNARVDKNGKYLRFNL